jgi:hypothetical protein
VDWHGGAVTPKKHVILAERGMIQTMARLVINIYDLIVRHRRSQGRSTGYGRLLVLTT